MLKNYFKTALRNLSRQKSYSLINLTGLAIGMACCLLILMFVNDELSYDNYNKNADRIYRVSIHLLYGGRPHSTFRPVPIFCPHFLGRARLIKMKYCTKNLLTV